MANTSKYRNYFITVNKGAACYDKIPDILREESNALYAYIIHNNDPIKQEHIHIVILYNNARTFTGMQKKFEGAHIEPCEYINSSIQYLIHQNAPEKEQYSILDIYSNMPDIATYFQTAKEPFDPDKILDYYMQGTKDFIMFYERFGASISKYQGLITRLITEMRMKEHRARFFTED